MKYYAIFAFIFLINYSFSTYATEQEPDRLIIKGDTILLHALPLEQWIDQSNYNKPFFPDSLRGFSTGCWRAYVAYWEIIDNRLYLTNIYNESKSAKADLNEMFGKKVKNGRVIADWFSDTVIAFNGKLLTYDHHGFSSVFEHEYEYVFDKGILKSTTYFDNSMSKNTPLFMGDALLNGHIDTLINWSALPTIEESGFAAIHVLANEQGRLDSIIHVYGSSEIFKQEALRVAKLITKFPVIYRRGKLQTPDIRVEFLFTAKKQKKYRKD
ncbi:hypothetical protein [Sphingobacterium sp. BN32]|uniref:hypothetical protein n=1 Tax=Sphingobacterium sp. BN32 TaxID=3058432 RepID=UPI00265CB23F|nr:hypothetical protein [Sphingobacterium sp. BN32]WKK60391.1 hypothetical protein QYC40_09130 [Sphingobacterium sp. BN32]